MKRLKEVIKTIVKKLLKEIMEEINEVDKKIDINQQEILEMFVEIINSQKQLNDKVTNLEVSNIELDSKVNNLKEYYDNTIINRINDIDCMFIDNKNNLLQIKGNLEFIDSKNKTVEENLNYIMLSLNRKNSNKRIRTVFLIHNVESWYTIQPIYENMLEESEFEPILIAVPRNYNSHDGTFEDKASKYLKAKYSKVITFDNYNSIPNDIVHTLNPDIIFRQSPWEEDIPKQFRTENIKQFKICYIPYGTITLPIENLHFNQNIHKYAWRLYCESEFHRKCYEQYNIVQDCNVIVSGYTKFEQMNKLLQSDGLIWPINSIKKPKLRILWAPHHSLEGWFGFSTFSDIYEDMYEFACDNPNIEIVLRPHPALTDTMNNSGLISKSKLEDYYNRFNALSNCYVDLGQEYIGLFKFSDILITDGVSFLFEYIITGKPIIHTDSRKHIGFNEYGKQFESSWYKAYTFDDLNVIVEQLLDGNDPLKNNRYELKEKVFDFTNNSPSQIIINDIKNALL